MNSFNNRNRGFGRTKSFGSRRFSRVAPKVSDSTRFIQKAVQNEQKEEAVLRHQFTDFGLEPNLLKRVIERGYTKPTPIQDVAIPLITKGGDVIGIAETGTGKTAAFLLPLITKILKAPNERVLIIVPTRELATQIKDELGRFCQRIPVRFTVCVGGVGYNSQITSLRQDPHFVVSTPGRLKDFIGRRLINLGRFHTLVLDEADRMVDMGFIKDVREIISQLPSNRQSLFFSATMSSEVKNLVKTFMNNPEYIYVKKQETSQNVDQDVIRYTDAFHKIMLLHNLLIEDECNKVIIFGRTKHGVEKLHATLLDRGFNSVSIHGNKNQSQRQRALDDFKLGRASILVATDVAARGLDIPNVSHVINYDAPENYEDYIHRIGRTGRASASGKAFTFVGMGD